MAHMRRIEYPGAFYHVMARGNRRETVFHDDEDRKFFLATLGEVCRMTGWRVHAWVLMGNHYHLCLETPDANLVAGMKWLQNTVTRRYNVRHHAWGRLFGERYKRRAEADGGAVGPPGRGRVVPVLRCARAGEGGGRALQSSANVCQVRQARQTAAGIEKISRARHKTHTRLTTLAMNIHEEYVLCTLTPFH